MYLTNAHVSEPIVYVIDDDQDICNSLTCLLDSVQRKHPVNPIAHF